MNNQRSNSRSKEVVLLHSQQYSGVQKTCVKVIMNTGAAEASCCFTSISGIIDEAEMYDTYNKRSFDLSEDKKPRCLIF